MHDTQVLALLRKHFKDVDAVTGEEVLRNGRLPPEVFRHDEMTPGQRYPSGYWTKQAMSDIWFERQLATISDRMRQGYGVPMWYHRRRHPVEK